MRSFESVESAGEVLSNPTATGPFSGTLSFSIGYDDNVFLVSDLPPFFPAGAKRDSLYAAFKFSGVYARPIGPNTIAGISGEISGVKYLEDQRPAFVVAAGDPDDYSRFTLHPRLFLTHRMTTPGGGTLSLTPSYAYRREGGASIDAVGLDSHQLRLDAAYSRDAVYSFGAHLLVAENDFDVSFPANPTANRDGTFYELGASVRIKPRPSHALTLGAALQHNDSKGSDFRYDGLKVYANYDTHLGRAYFGSFGASFSTRDYSTGFAALAPGIVPRRDQQVLSLTASVLKPLDSRRAIQGLIAYDNYASNSPAFSGDRMRAEISYVLSLP